MTTGNSLWGDNGRQAKVLKKFVAWITIAAFLGQPTLAAAQAVADPNAPAQHRPTVEAAQNGVPVVQITAPSAAGVSRNLYQALSVEQMGLILNNSRLVTQTQLGGYITGNPNLAGGSARVILNQVTGTGASNLRGFIEVAGQRAEVIIANPNGIAVNGGGFINTSRAVLTTGTPIFGGSGSLEAFRITGGQITVEGSGLDASTTDRVDLLSRAVQVNAGVWAKELNIVTGANEVNNIDLSTQKIAGTEAAPAVSLDVAALGGMYANKIKLVGTEAGVGVNSRGTIAAAGDLTLTQEGKIVLAGSTSAAGNIVAATGSDFTNQGTLYAQGNTNISAAGALTNTGVLAAAQNTAVAAQSINATGALAAGLKSDGTVGTAGDLTLTASGAIVAKGRNLAGGNLAMNGATVDLSGATTYAGGNAAVTATAGGVDNTGGNLQAGGALNISAAGTVKNDITGATAGQISAGKLTINAGDISNKGGQITQTGSSNTNITATGAIDNTGGTIATNGDSLIVQAGSVTNSQGQIQQAGAGMLTVNITGDLRNDGGNVATNGQLNIGAGNINNAQGSLMAQKQVAVSAAALTNDNGIIASGTESVNITATGALSNRQGTIQGQKGLNITAQSFDNQGGRAINLDTSKTIVTTSQGIQNQSGEIGGNGDVLIAAKSLNNAGGKVTAQNDLSLSTPDGINNTGGTLSAGQNLTINQSAANLANSQGNISAIGNLTLRAATVDNSGGKLAANADISLATQNLSGAGGNVIAGRDVIITSNSDFTHGAGSQVQANRDVNVNITGTVLNQGNITSVNNINITSAKITNDTNATVTANATANVTATGNITNNGQVSSSVINLTAGQTLTNTGAVIGDAVTAKADTISNNGASAIIATTGDTNLYARTTLENKDSANIYSMGSINIAGSANKDASGQYTDSTGSVLNSSATIQADKDITIKATDIINTKRVFVFSQQVVSDTSYDQYGVGAPNTTKWGPVWVVYWGSTSAVLLTGSDRGAYPTDWMIRDVVTQAVVTQDSPNANITAGRNIKIRGTNLTNNMSNIMAGGTLDSVTTNFSNTNVNVLSGTDTKTILTVTCHEKYDGGATGFTDGPRDVTTYQAPLPGYSSIVSGGQLVNVQTVNLNNSTVVPGAPLGTAQPVQSSGQAATVASRQAGNPNLTLPSNGLYTVHTDPTSQYLVETNPRFANYSNFVSSDYMMSQLNLNPAQLEKRMGDAFYEQQLIRQQVAQLTGRTFLTGYTNNNDEYQALLNSGVTYARQFNLEVGVALSPEQMAQLTSPMVWMVEEVVDGQKVLVPVVYVPQSVAGSLQASGALITGGNVQIVADGNVNNTGSIVADNLTKIEAANITNVGGTIGGGQTTDLKATVGNIINQSGTINGQQVQLNAERGDIKNETLSLTNSSKAADITTVGNIASISGGQSVSLKAGQDVSITGAKVTAGQDVTIDAGRNLAVDSVQSTYRIGGVIDNTTNTTSSIQAGGNVQMTAQQDATLRGAQVTAGQDLSLVAGGNVNISAVKDEKISDVTYNNRDNFTRIRTDDQTVIGSSLQAGGNVTVSAVSQGSSTTGTDRGNVTISGSSITSNSGGVTIAADKNVTIREETEKHESLIQTHTKKKGFLSTTTTDTLNYSSVDQVRGSTISGDKVTVTSGNDLTVKGSNVVATNDVNLTARNNVNITTAQENSQSENYSKTTKSGIFGGGGLGLTIGSRSKKETLDGQAVSQVGSSVGSLTGNVNITADRDVKVTGSDIISGNDTNIKGQNVTIEAATNASQSKYAYEFKQSGLTVSLTGGAVTNATNLAFDARRIGNVSDERLKALYAYKAAQELKELGKYAGDLTKDVSINVSVGSTRYSTETVSTATSAQGSTVTAGGNVSIKATGSGAKDAAGRAADGDVNILGSTVGGRNVTLDAAKDVNLVAADNTDTSTTNTSSSSSGVGVSVGAKTGVIAQGSKSSLNANGDGTTHTQTVVAASDTLIIMSGSDTNIVGSRARGDNVNMMVVGNLNIASLQDTDNYSERSSSVGGKIGLGAGMPSGVSTSKGKVDSTYASVTGQSGVYAGQSGFNIYVGGNTDLKGAVIASDATPDKNKLSTGTLTYSDIQNKAEYSASSSGIGYGWGNPTTKINGKEIPNPKNGFSPEPGVTVSGSAESTTKSAVAFGTVEVRSNPAADLSGLSRDTVGALNALGKIFDSKTVAERQELISLFGEVAFNEIHRQSILNGWAENGPEKIIFHTIVAGIMSQLAGGDFTSGAASGLLNEALAAELRNIADPGVRQLASALIGAIAAKLVGGDAQTGAAIAASATKNNFFFAIFARQGLAAAAGAAYRFLTTTPEGQAILARLGVTYENWATAGEEIFAKLIQEGTALYVRFGGTGGVWGRATFQSEQLLQRHLVDHAATEWGEALTAAQYIQKARDLLNSNVGGEIQGFTNRLGWTFRYNTTTNEYALGSPQGTISTLMRPSDGMQYWLEQVARYGGL